VCILYIYTHTSIYMHIYSHIVHIIYSYKYYSYIYILYTLYIYRESSPGGQQTFRGAVDGRSSLWTCSSSKSQWKGTQKEVPGRISLRRLYEGYPLVNSHITMERSTIFNGKIHYKWPFSIAMLNYQRVL